jgi:UDPglucose 6-dehydrogenase
MAREQGLPGHVVSAVARVNDEQVPRMVEKITKAAGALKEKTFCFLGLAFKPQTSDTRESPAMRIIEEVVKGGGTVRAFDPAAMEEARHTLPSITYGKDAYDAARGSDVLVIATEWNEFRNLDWDRMKSSLRAPVVVDLRNVYDPRHMRDLGFQYTSVGR